MILTFGKFSVSRKPIINGGAIRPVGLLFILWPIYEELVVIFSLVIRMSALL